MARKAFFSFDFEKDHWRASQVRQIGAIEGNPELTDNDWEAVKKKGDAAIEKWIDDQLSGRSCAIILVGARTASRPWVKYEIKRAWQLKKGVVGIRIHNLLNSKQEKSVAGANPFSAFNVGDKDMASIVTLYDPPGADSKAVYKSISDKIAGLAEAAVETRGKY